MHETKYPKTCELIPYSFGVFFISYGFVGIPSGFAASPVFGVTPPG